jgi:hypothetical protein
MARPLSLALLIEDEQVVVVNAAAGAAKMASENAVENFIVFALLRKLNVRYDTLFRWMG